MSTALRRLLARLALAAACALAVASPRAPATAADDAAAELDKKQLAEWFAICDEWAAAQGDGARMLVEGKAAKLPPLPAAAVKPIAEHLFELAAKTGPRLKKSGREYFYDEKAKKGLYMVAGAKRRGGGLLLALHGGGEGVGDAGSAFGVFSCATAEGMTVVAPESLRKVSSAWNEEDSEQFVLDLIDAAKRTFEIDPNRIYVAGHSMGGDGSWMIGGRNADLFAGAAPLAGSIMPYMRPGAPNRKATPLSDYTGLMEGVIPNLLHLPCYVFHSADDPNEAIHPDDIAAGHLKRLAERFPGGYELHYERIDGNGHALPPGGVKPIVEWLAKHERVTYPREVIWETWWGWKRQFYWLYHPEPDDAWRYHAKIVEPNHVDVTATVKLVEGRMAPKELELVILASPRLFDMEKPLRITSGGKTLFEGLVPRTLWALLVTVGRRNDRAQWFEGHVSVVVPRTIWRDLWDEP